LNLKFAEVLDDVLLRVRDGGKSLVLSNSSRKKQKQTGMGSPPTGSLVRKRSRLMQTKAKPSPWDNDPAFP